MPDISVFQDAAIWSILLIAFFWAYPKYSTYWVVGLLLVLKAMHTFMPSLSHDATAFWFNIAFFGALLLAFFLAQNSPNYRWLIGCMVLIKTLDVLLYEWLLSTGAFYYLAVSLMDVAIIFCIAKRSIIARFLAKQNWPVVSKASRECMDNFGFSHQEMAMMGAYWLFVFINIASCIEWLIRDYTDYYPVFVYNLYSPIKMLIGMSVFLLIFAIACGGAKGIATNRNIA